MDECMVVCVREKHEFENNDIMPCFLSANGSFGGTWYHKGMRWNGLVYGTQSKGTIIRWQGIDIYCGVCTTLLQSNGIIPQYRACLLTTYQIFQIHWIAYNNKSCTVRSINSNQQLRNKQHSINPIDTHVCPIGHSSFNPPGQGLACGHPFTVNSHEYPQ